VLTSDEQGFRIEIDLLKGLYDGSSFQSETASAPLHLSPDGNVLRIRGKRILLRGPRMKVVVRKLVEAHETGRHLRASDLLAVARIQSPTLSKAFNNSPAWEALRRYLHHEGGFVWLEV
jgi:hypothetical protein